MTGFIKAFVTKAWFLLLVPVYFILHNFFLYHHVVDFSKLKGYVFFWLLFPLLTYGALWLRYRSKERTAAVWSLVILILFFFYSPIIKFFGTTKILFFLTKISVILGLIIAFLLIIFIFAKRFNFEKSRLPGFIILLVSVLLVYEGGVYAYHKINGTADHLQLLTSAEEPQLPTTAMKEKPDIFYIIFDEQTSAKEAASFLRYNNSTLDLSLRNQSFFVSDSASSAYYYTAVALASVFRGSPFKEKQNKKAEMVGYQMALYNLAQNQFIPYLKENGYEIINTAGYKLYNDEKVTPDKIERFGKFEQIVLNQTFSERIQLQVMGIINDRYPQLMKNSPALKTKLVRFQNKVGENCNELLNAAARKRTAPAFVYAHFSLPHLPVYFDSTGHSLTDDGYIEQNYKQNTHQAYMTNLGAARHFILKLAKGIQERSNGNAVIIIQADHGYRGSPKHPVPDSIKYSIFNAVYFPDKDYHLLSNSLYSVNTFRILLNKYAGAQLPLLVPQKNKTQTLLSDEE